MPKTPDTDNGYTRLAHELIEELARTRLAPGETSVLFALFRRTYGHQKKEDWISFTQFQTLTDLDQSTIIRSLQSLEKKKIITVRRVPGRNYYSFNKHHSQWTTGIHATSTNASVTHATSTDATGIHASQPLAPMPVTIDSLTKDNILPTGVPPTGIKTMSASAIANYVPERKEIIDAFKQAMGQKVLDGSEKMNSVAAKRILLKAIAASNGDKAKAMRNVLGAISMAPKDSYHGPKCTSLLYLERHWLEILRKAVKQAPKLVTVTTPNP